MKYLLLLLFSSLLLATCKKDPPPPEGEGPKDECKFFNYPSDTFGGPWKIDYPYYEYFAPSFNPTNSDEIAMGRSGNGNGPINGTKMLCIGNLKTGTVDEIMEWKDIWSINWIDKNWIAFSDKSGIKKVKTNGDSFTTIFENNSLEYVHMLQWSPDRKYISWQGWNDLYVATADGKIDTLIKGNIFTHAWSGDSKKIAISDGSKGTGYLDVEQDFAYHAIFPEKAYLTMYWPEASETLALQGNIDNDPEIEFFHVNVQTGATQIKNTYCSYYYFPTYSSQSNQWLGRRVVQDSLGDRWMLENSYFMLIDTDGKLIEKIEFPDK